MSVPVAGWVPSMYFQVRLLVHYFLQSTVSKNRVKRQSSSLVTFCEPRFVQLDGQADQFVLMWLCPENETEPSLEAQAILCDPLFEAVSIETCKPPNSQERTPPTTPPLTDSRCVFCMDAVTCIQIDMQVSASYGD